MALKENLSELRAAILAADDFEDLELYYPMYRLQEEGIKTTVIAAKKDPVKGKTGYSVQPDLTIDEAHSKDFDLLIVPGGKAPERMRLNDGMVRFVRDFDRDRKVIAAICHAGQLLISADILRGRRVTCVPAIRDDVINAGAKYQDTSVVRDENLVTSRRPPDLPDFMRTTIQALREISKIPIPASAAAPF